MKLGIQLSFAASFATMMLTAAPAWSGVSIQVSDAPTNNLTMTVEAIKSAQHSLLLNIYDLSSPEIADALMDRIQSGVQVQILEEGEPFGKMSTAAHGIQLQLAHAMHSTRNLNDHFYVMTGQEGKVKRRFHYDHAKYTVIDGQTLLIGSENYSPTGNPKPGTVGNRGWEVLVHDPALSAKFTAMFKADTDLSHGDVLDLTRQAAELENLSDDGDDEADLRKPPQKPAKPVKPAKPAHPGGSWNGMPTLNADSAQMITSPDTSLSGLIAAIRSARRSIDVQQMEFATKWGMGSDTSPLLTEVIAAAKRGVVVRVLVNDERVFDTCNHPPHLTNVNTAELLNKTATSEHLKLQARVANVQAMGVDYIHNKGVLIDDDLTLVSSINWTENAVEKNREAAVLIHGTDVHAHYLALFNSDWSSSSKAGAAPNRHCESSSLSYEVGEESEPLNSTSTSASSIPVTNFRTVEDSRIYRSARPGDAGLTAMANRLDLKTDLDLEDDDEAVAQEEVTAAALGIRFISKPMSGLFSPKDQEIDEILAILSDPANYPILVHCQHGEDRTGLVVGLYRVQSGEMSPPQAYQEMKDDGFHTILVALSHYFKKRTGWDD